MLWPMPNSKRPSKKSEAEARGRWRRPFLRRTSSCGRPPSPTNIALGSSHSYGASGRQSASGRSPPCSTALNGAIWWALSLQVHPASGRTVFHLATTVSIPVFEVELAAFARQVGASPRKQIVLVLDRAGWHTSVKLRVPDHVHLLFLPPYSPELQPAEHLWLLTNAALVNQHFATIEDLEDAQFARCLALQHRPELIRSTTCFYWWPKHIAKRRGPKRN
ncbi:MAG TPA: transposase [Ktedonobacterales bacterium]